MNLWALICLISIVGFLGSIILLIVRIVNWDSKWPAILGMLFCVVLFFVGIVFMEASDGEVKDTPKQSAQSKEGDAVKESDNPEKTNENITDNLEVTEYMYESDYFNYYFLTIKNNSEFDLDLSVSVNFYGEDGNLVGAKSGSQEAVESGYSTLLYFMPDEKYTRVEYELDARKENRYECVLSDLSFEGTVAKDKVILSVTNNGEKAADFVEASVLFFKGENVVGFSQNYIVDDDSELKPGKTINKEMNCYSPFDDYLVFFSGRR